VTIKGRVYTSVKRRNGSGWTGGWGSSKREQTVGSITTKTGKKVAEMRFSYQESLPGICYRAKGVIHGKKGGLRTKEFLRRQIKERRSPIGKVRKGYT